MSLPGSTVCLVFGRARNWCRSVPWPLRRASCSASDPHDAAPCQREDCVAVLHVFHALDEPVGVPEGYVVEVRSDASAYDGLDWLTDIHSDQVPAACRAEAVVLRFWHEQRPGRVDPLALTYPTMVRALALGPAKGVGLPEHATIVEMSCPLIYRADDTSGEDALERGLDQIMFALRAWQRSVYVASRVPLRLAARERLPAVLTIAIGYSHGDTYITPSGVGLWVQGRHAPGLAPAEPLTDRQLAGIDQAVGTGGGAFGAFLDLRRAARIAARRDGDNRTAVLLAGIAGETLLDDLLIHLHWELGTDPRVAAGIVSADRLFKRVKRDYAPLLGGNWDPDRQPGLRSWAQDLHALRNRVAHQAADPDTEQTVAAFSGLDGLVAHVADRLGTAQVARRFPHTAHALLGDDGLAGRSVQGAAIERATVLRRQYDVGGRQGRYSAAVDRELLVLSGVAAATESLGVGDGYTFSTQVGDGPVQWIQHHRAAHLARRVAQPADATEELLSALPALMQRARAIAREPAGVAVAVETDLAQVVAAGPWADEWTLMPGTEIDVPAH